MENGTALLTSPQSASNPNPNPNLRPTKSTAFKRDERRKRKDRKRREKLAESLCCWDPLSSRPSDRSGSSISVSDTPWPCDPDPLPPNHDSSEWDPFVPPCAPQKPTPLSPLISSKDAQTSAFEMCKSFFVVEEEEEEEENVDCTDEEGKGYERVLGFFSDLFQTHVGLARFYEERKDKGVLVCLVCGKKFGSCISLLHHASTVTKTRRRQVHRVYGVAMSQIFGLKAINQLGSKKEVHLIQKTNLLNLTNLGDMEI